MGNVLNRQQYTTLNRWT